MSFERGFERTNQKLVNSLKMYFSDYAFKISDLLKSNVKILYFHRITRRLNIWAV